jgi:hypothetical protein
VALGRPTRPLHHLGIFHRLRLLILALWTRHGELPTSSQESPLDAALILPRRIVLFAIQRGHEPGAAWYSVGHTGNWIFADS